MMMKKKYRFFDPFTGAPLKEVKKIKVKSMRLKRIPDEQRIFSLDDYFFFIADNVSGILVK